MIGVIILFVRHLLDACKEEIEAGNTPMGIFTTTGWKNVVSKIAQKSDVLKKEYSTFMEFKNCATGLGWDETKQTIRCNNREKGIKCMHVKFRKQGPKFLDDLHIIFGKSHVSGASAPCSGDISSDEEGDDDMLEVPKPAEKAEKTVNPGKNKRKGLSSAKSTCEKIEAAAEKISTSVEASSPSLCNAVATIKAVIRMVKDCGVEEGTALMHTATSLIVKPEFREVFSSPETNKGRLDLIEREHEKEMMKRQ
ncbi:hypothetical protein PVAP13_8KG108303 [Panicum virgatum]|uniref:Myb/SANT-like domain-containing protein n=1 Tax=Panicum virgatum TaxID=38727 RepID=A0A8T0PHJ7_PANVG|nr:hypothetical protein PVAP13_8KG108303 [Panicum virgatum]